MVKNLKQDYGVSGKGSDSDSEKLQKAIDDVSKSGGGMIYIPSGEYKLGNIELKSNVHLEIVKDAVIIPYVTKPGKSLTIFSLDGNISNVSIQGKGGKFSVKLETYVPGVTVFRFGSMNNFMLSYFIVFDQLTKFSSLAFGISKNEDGTYTRPKNGLIKNGDTKNALYGYGLVQIQAGENLLFENISCTGGATLRIETGLASMNDLQIGGVDKIYGRNILCTDGNAGAMISPHAMHNGSVDIDGVTTTNCGFGVRVDNGFIAMKYKNPNLTAGTFSKVVVKNVKATFGTTAQIKPKHYKYIPVYREKYITKKSVDGNESFIGPSITAVLNDVKTYASAVQISNVVADGFLCQKPIITEADVHSTMDCGVSSVNKN